MVSERFPSSLLLIIITLLFISTSFGAKPPPNSVSMRVINNAAEPIELFWIDTFSKTKKGEEKYVKQTSKPIRNGTDTQIHSYNTHEFLVRFLKHRSDLETTFVKGPKEEVVTIRYNKTHGLYTTQTTKFDEVMDTIKHSTNMCSSFVGDEFSSCVANGVLSEITKLTDLKEEMKASRDSMSSRLRNYTCNDDAFETTTPESTHTMSIHEQQYTVNVLLDKPAAKIWYVDDFITPEECKILMEHGKPRLRRATVAAEDGTSIISESRKAQQTSYHLKNFNSDPLWPLYARILYLVNSRTGMSLEPEGQEDFTIIQYNVDDQYTPHCDGTCDGSAHTPAGRVATTVLYCKTADRGGQTTFTKSDIFVKPKNGSATFFSYKDLETGSMDSGWTEHSGCPVLEGEKWITTTWLREGVSLESPWDIFDPNGIRILMPEDNDNMKSAEIGIENDGNIAEKDEF